MQQIDFENRLGLTIGIFLDRASAVGLNLPKIGDSARQPTLERWTGGVTDRNTRGVSSAHASRTAVLIEMPFADHLALPARIWGAGDNRPEQTFELEQLSPGYVNSDDGAEGLVFSAMDVDPAIDKEFNEWYDAEHMPLLRKVPGMRCARRYRTRSGPLSYFAVYHLDSIDTYKEQAWIDANKTPWIRRIHRHRLRTLHMIFTRLR